MAEVMQIFPSGRGGREGREGETSTTYISTGSNTVSNVVL